MYLNFFDENKTNLDNTGEIILWNTLDYKQIDTIKLFPGYIGDMQWLLDNSILASSGNDFLLFDLEKVFP